MLRPAAFRRPFLLLCLVAATGGFVGDALADGPRGFDTVVIDAGHGGYDRGGGPGQVIPEKPYTLDTAIRLERALRQRGFRTVMTRSSDVFVSLPERAAIANASGDAVFVSIHYNSAPRAGAHGYETYYYRSDSFGLAERLHAAQLATLDTEDRHVRRRPFYVLRTPRIPAVLCEGGFLTSPEESRIVQDVSYRQRWAENIANALVAQRREGDPTYLGSQPPVTTERLVGSGGGRSGHHARGGRVSRRYSRGSSRGRSRGRGTSHHGSSRTHHSSSTTHHRRRRNN